MFPMRLDNKSSLTLMTKMQKFGWRKYTLCSCWISSHTLWDMSADLTLGRWWRGLSSSFLISLSLMLSLLPKTTSSRHLWKQRKEQRGAEEFSHSHIDCQTLQEHASAVSLSMFSSCNLSTFKSTLSVQYIWLWTLFDLFDYQTIGNTAYINII